MMERRKELLSITSGDDLDKFLSFVKEHKTSLQELMEGYSKKQLDELWEGIQQTCATTLLMIDINDDQNTVEGEMKRVLDVLECIVALASAVINQPQAHISACLLSTAVVLDGLLLPIPESASKLKNSIASLFESWWKQGLDGKEELITNTLIHCLQRSLEAKGAAGVKRVWSLHSVLEQVDMGNQSSQLLRELLQQCVLSVDYLRIEEGRRFIGFVLTLDASLTDSLHRIIKNHIPTTPKLYLEKYGEVYFRAWQRASPLTEKIEKDCIQDLMYHAVHAQKMLAPSLRKVLAYIHSQKKQKGVDRMLVSLYEPFIWRSLKVANAHVRGNAAWLLIDVFPLQDPDLNVEMTDSLLQKQFDILQTLLEDPVPFVRSLTALGLFKIMSVYWEMIPAATLKNMVSKMLQDLVYDGSSAEVRESVVKGFGLLLDNHLCHVFLKPILPELRNTIHDSSEKVRVAMTELLLKVQRIRAIKFWHVVPVEQLLARLEVDSPPVVKRLMNLLFRSFLPLDKSSDMQLERCKTLIQSCPGAARVFFRNAHHHMNTMDTVSYIVMICRCILERIRDASRKGGRNGDRQQEDDEQEDRSCQDEVEDEDENDLSIHNTVVMRGFVEAMVILWTNISTKLQKADNKKLEDDLHKKFSLAIPEMLKVFEDPQTCVALILLAGHLPPSSVLLISRSCVSKLKAMTTKNKKDDYGCLLEAMCKWGKAKDLFDLVEEWLEQSFDSLEISQSEASKTGKSMEKSVKFVEPSKPNPRLAVQYMSYVILHPVCRTVIMSNHVRALTNICKLLHRVLGCIDKVVTDQIEEENDLDDGLLVECFTLYCKLILLLNNKSESDQNVLYLLNELLIWGVESILPHLAGGTKETATQPSRKRSMSASSHNTSVISKDVTKCLLETCRNSLMIGIGNGKFISRLSDFCVSSLQADEDLSVLPQALSCLYQITEFVSVSPPKSDRSSDDVSDDTVAEFLDKMFASAVAFAQKKNTESTKVLSTVKMPMVETLNNVHKLSTEAIEQRVMVAVVTAVLTELSQHSQNLDLEECGENFSTLPPVSSWLCDIVSKKMSIYRSFMHGLMSTLSSEEGLGIHRLHGVIHLIGTAAKCMKSMTELQDCCTVVRTQVEQLNQVTDEDTRETMEAIHSKFRTCQEILHIVP